MTDDKDMKVREAVRRGLPAPGHEACSVGRSDKYDAYYCRTCAIWLEPRCRDTACEMCSIRPDSPSSVL